MENTPPPLPESPPPRRRRWLRWLLGCGCLLAVLCCGVPGAGLVALNHWGNSVREADEREFVDRLFREAFAEGDLGIAFDRADPRLRKAHERDAFLAHFGRLPAVPPREPAVLKRHLTVFHESRLCVKVVFTLPGADEVVIYCREDDEGRLRLLGVTPGLDAGVPAALLRHFEAIERGERQPGGGLWDLFD